MLRRPRASLGHGPAGGALVAVEAHGDEALVHLVGAHDAGGSLDQLLDLLQQRVDQRWSADVQIRVGPGVALFDETGDGLGVTARQLRGG
ncbi:MAG: hypothetical protein ACRD12_03330 [Acidimicrobiales bacterium]